MLKSSIANEDENHEVEFLLSQIEGDSINDTTITIPASIIVYQKDAVGRKLSEFDGLIIHPMRKQNQVIFLEAKNRDITDVPIIKITSGKIYMCHRLELAGLN